MAKAKYYSENKTAWNYVASDYNLYSTVNPTGWTITNESNGIKCAWDGSSAVSWGDTAGTGLALVLKDYDFTRFGVWNPDSETHPSTNFAELNVEIVEMTSAVGFAIGIGLADGDPFTPTYDAGHPVNHLNNQVKVTFATPSFTKIVHGNAFAADVGTEGTAVVKYINANYGTGFVQAVNFIGEDLSTVVGGGFSTSNARSIVKNLVNPHLAIFLDAPASAGSITFSDVKYLHICSPSNK